MDKTKEFHEHVEQKLDALYEVLVEHDIPAHCLVIYADQHAAQFATVGHKSDAEDGTYEPTPDMILLLNKLASNSPLTAEQATALTDIVLRHLHVRVMFGATTANTLPA